MSFGELSYSMLIFSLLQVGSECIDWQRERACSMLSMNGYGRSKLKSDHLHRDQPRGTNSIKTFYYEAPNLFFFYKEIFLRWGILGIMNGKFELAYVLALPTHHHGDLVGRSSENICIPTTYWLTYLSNNYLLKNYLLNNYLPTQYLSAHYLPTKLSPSLPTKLSPSLPIYCIKTL